MAARILRQAQYQPDRGVLGMGVAALNLSFLFDFGRVLVHNMCR